MAFGSSDGHVFFNSWALWQKMTFVLACGIVVTIFLGFIKLWFDRKKVAKHTKLDKGKQVQTPEMLEAQPVTAVSVETKDDIPFGIRAIQSGIEVDGVWISRSNTPVASSRNSFVSDRKGPGSYNNSQLELPQAAMIGSSRNSSRAPSSAFDRAVSAERIPHEGSRASSPGQGQAPIRCGNCNHNIAHNPTALQSLETPQSALTSGPPSPRPDALAPSGRTSDKSSRRTSDESDYMAITQDVRTYETAYIRASNTVAVDPRTDLDLLQSHRMSHVAETGQLTPRVRRPGQSGEWASVAEDKVQTSNGVSYFMPRKTPSPPLAPIADVLAGAATTHATISSQDGHASNEAKQGVPLMESYAPKAAYYPETYEPRGPQHQFSYDEVPYEVTTEQNQRDSQILRKVNPGFEILKPGTFQPPTPEELAENERRQSKKLQKKRRSSETRQSAFIEGV